MSPAATRARGPCTAASPDARPTSGPWASRASRTTRTARPAGTLGGGPLAGPTTITSPLTSPRRPITRCSIGTPRYGSSSLSRPKRLDPPPARTIPVVSARVLRRTPRIGGRADRRPPLGELVAEPPLDAQVAARDVVIERRGDLHDLVVLNVQLHVTADAAVRADRLHHALPGLVPVALPPQVVLALEHQRAGRADPDAVAAVHARRLRERHGELRGDARVEPAAGDGDRERVLSLDPAGLDALVAEDAARVVPNVQLVVDLHRLGDGRRQPVDRLLVMAGAPCVTLPGLRRGCRGAVALGLRPVVPHPARDVRTRSESVRTFIPGSTRREQAGASTREPSTSTTQTRHTFTGVRVSRKQ